MKQRINYAISSAFALALACVYFCYGCQSAPPQPKPYIIQIDATKTWMWQITARNNTLIAESVRDFPTSLDALDNYRAVYLSVKEAPAPDLIKDKKL